VDIIEFGKRPRRAHNYDRDRDDFYSEPEWCSRRLFAVEEFVGLVWDPASGLGTIPRAARAAGLENFASDIADHGYGSLQDFLKAPAPTTGAFNVVTNPPFALAREFVERAIELGATKTAGHLSGPAPERCALANDDTARTDLVIDPSTVDAARQDDCGRHEARQRDK
jgi:hypothetical protein